jgi:hypothetical protein
MKARNLMIASLATLITVCSVAAAQSTAHVTTGNALVDGILSQASKMVFKDANGMLTNRYGGGYTTTYLTWPNPTTNTGMYTAYSRCASFTTMLLKATYGWTPNKALGNSPFAHEYYSSIMDSRYGFVKRPDWDSVRMGDILASAYNDGSADTGHVMIVLDMDAMTEMDEDGNQIWRVQVLDSTKTPHTNDTRNTFAQLNQGVGRGEIAVWTQNGQIVTWSWSVGGTFYNSTARPLTVGYFKTP